MKTPLAQLPRHSERQPCDRHSPAAAACGVRNVRDCGFTMIELMVVVSVMGFIMAIVYPALSKLVSSGVADMGVNTVTAAAQTIRAYSTRDKANLDLHVAGAKYSGTAMLFTPAGEIRFVENSQLAKSGAGAGDYLETAGLNGYTDIRNREYVHLPAGVGVAGIVSYDGANSVPVLIAPPFAVVYNQFGVLQAGDLSTPAKHIYYDGNYNGVYETGSSRPSGYSTNHWDPKSSAAPPTLLDVTSNKYKLPFETIEAVIGVMVYNKSEIQASGVDLAGVNLAGIPGTGYLDNPARKWLLKISKDPFNPSALFEDPTLPKFKNMGYRNARVLLFGRNSGSVSRE